MKLQDRLTPEEVLETYINGNISDAKLHIRRMKPRVLLTLVELADEAGQGERVRALIIRATED